MSSDIDHNECSISNTTSVNGSITTNTEDLLQRLPEEGEARNPRGGTVYRNQVEEQDRKNI